MAKELDKAAIYISGMTCASCEQKIGRLLKQAAGVKQAQVSYATGVALVTYDPALTSPETLREAIRNLGYKTPAGRNKGSLLDACLFVFGLYVIMRQLGLSELFNVFPLARAGMDYAALLVIGLLTSVHCLAMCGGINLSQCLGADRRADTAASLLPGFFYNGGRLLSYTLVGALVGALGSVISFSGSMKGAVQLAAGAFMVIMGGNMLGCLGFFRRFTPRLPDCCAGLSRKLTAAGPFSVGLLNGFMPCGPLQAMQLYALSTGDPGRGALSMFVFGLGTLPLMFGLGALSRVFSAGLSDKIRQAGAVLVVMMGLSMFNSGLALSNFSLPAAAGAPAAAASGEAVTENGMQLLTTALSSGRYTPIVVRKGLPVRWTISAAPGTINGCNNRIFIPEYGIEHRFARGDNIIEFIPQKTGVFTYTCWMGMIRSSITVVE